MPSFPLWSDICSMPQSGGGRGCNPPGDSPGSKHTRGCRVRLVLTVPSHVVWPPAQLRCASVRPPGSLLLPIITCLLTPGHHQPVLHLHSVTILRTWWKWNHTHSTFRDRLFFFFPHSAPISGDPPKLLHILANFSFSLLSSSP